MSHANRRIAHRREVVRSWEASGLSAAAYARLIGASQWTLYSWRKQLRSRRLSAGRGPRSTFVEIVSATAATASATPPLVAPADRGSELELLVADDLVLRIRRGFDAATLRRIVAALRVVGTEGE